MSVINNSKLRKNEYISKENVQIKAKNENMRKKIKHLDRRVISLKK